MVITTYLLLYTIIIVIKSEIDILFEKTYNTKPQIKDPITIIKEKSIQPIEQKKQTNSVFPYCGIGFIDVDKVYGSCCLIGDNIILTSAQFLYDHDTKKEVNPSDINVFFVGGINKNEEDLKSHSFVKEFFYPEEYKNGNLNENYGILILEENLGRKHGHYTLKVTPKSIEKMEVLIYGYLDDKSNIGHRKMHGMEGVAILKDNNKLFYPGVEVFPGEIGTPILLYDRVRNVVYTTGIHSKVSVGNINEGVSLSESRVKKINMWLEKLYKKDLLSSVGVTNMSNLSNVSVDEKDSNYIEEGNLFVLLLYKY